jgi:hypothetical protein
VVRTSAVVTRVAPIDDESLGSGLEVWATVELEPTFTLDREAIPLHAGGLDLAWIEPKGSKVKIGDSVSVEIEFTPWQVNVLIPNER